MRVIIQEEALRRSERTSHRFCNNCGAKMDAKDNNVPTNEPNKICPINGAPCNECVPGAYCAKMDGEEHECD